MFATCTTMMAYSESSHGFPWVGVGAFGLLALGTWLWALYECISTRDC